MTEPRDPEPMPPPQGPPRAAWFDGILDGRRGDVAELRAAVARLDDLRVFRVDLDIDGGRFSLLLDDATIDGQRLDQARQEALLDALCGVVGASAEPERVESTLRCTMLYDDQVVETVFRAERGSLRPLSRARPIGPGDQARLAVPPGAGGGFSMPHVSTRQLAIVLPLLLIAFSLLAWRSGLVDRAFGSGAGELRLDTGAFAATLSIEVEADWGDYLVRLRRGEGYPATPEDVEALTAAAETTADQAAVRAVADGAEIWVQLRAADGRWIGARSCSLRSLLSDADGQASVNLPGRIAAGQIRLSLDSGEEPK